jgi:nucleotide-binding universal stress UspA family protein
MTELTWRTICCPLDLCDASRAALPLAIQLARQLDAELLLLHVLSFDPAVPEPLPPAHDLPALVRRELAGARRQAVRAGVRSVRVAVRTGDPAEEIVELVRREPIDLLVMGTHARKGLQRVALGSVAARVVRSAPCPVLTVSGPAAARVAPLSAPRAGAARGSGARAAGRRGP